MDEIANRIVNFVAPSFQTAQVTLEQYVQAEIPPLYASASGVASLLLELLTNSLKACKPGDTAGLKVVKDDENVIFEVYNSASNHPMFPKQRNMATVNSTGQGSSGIGLALAELVAHAHNSCIEIKKEPGMGTVFTVRLSQKAPVIASEYWETTKRELSEPLNYLERAELWNYLRYMSCIRR